MMTIHNKKKEVTEFLCEKTEFPESEIISIENPGSPSTSIPDSDENT